MRRLRLLLSLCSLLALCAFALPPADARPLPAAVPEFVTNQLLIGFRPETDEAARAVAVARHGGRTLQRLPGTAVQVVELPANRPTGSAASAYAADPDVRYVEPNAIYRVAATPNDPYYADGSLWNLAAIGAPAAWDTTTGSSNVVVGILDTGLDYTHPDLAANVWTAPAGWNVQGCGPGTRGYQFLAGVTGCDPRDSGSHGTHVAGIIGAAGNNGTGVIGVNWRVTLLPLQFIGTNGAGTTSDAAAAINAAIAIKRAGVNLRVLNASWGGPVFSQTLLDAIRAAGDNDILIVAAAGNAGLDLDKTPIYPASYGARPSYALNVIAVAMHNSQFVLDPTPGAGTNYGRYSVHLSAPGTLIRSTVPGNGYDYLTGTSMAAPHVSGAAALLLAAPGLATLPVAALKARLLYCGDSLPGGDAWTITGRRLNVARALSNGGCAAIPIYTLTTAALPPEGGTIAAAPDGAAYLSETPVRLTASPAPGYRFAGWRVGDTALGQGNPLTLPMLDNSTVTASFVPISYTLALGTAGNGQVAATPPGATYQAGAVVTLTATPAPNAVFAGWTIDGVLAGGDNPYALTMDRDHSVTATFAAGPTGGTFALALGATAGGTVAALPAGPYAAGTRVALGATADPGFVFTGWTIDGQPGGRATPYTLTMASAHSVVANFAPAMLLNLSATAGGSVTTSTGTWSGGSPYPAGTTVTLTATTNSGQVFTGWTIDGAFRGWATPLTLTMDAAHTVVANFATRPRFTDLPAGPPPYEAISQLGARQIVRGYATGAFGQYDTTLRAQMAALIVRAMGWDAESHDTPFSDRADVDDNLWRNVGTLAHYDVARGYGDGTFGSLDPVLQVQVIAFIARAMEAKGYWTQQPDDATLYPNIPGDSGHRLDLATFVHYAGAIPGTVTGNPWVDYAIPATRGWFATALWQALDSYFNADRVP